MMSSESIVRQNFATECEAAINRQVNMELEASYAYMAFSIYFDQDDVSFPRVSEYFHKASHEEREHAEKLARYQNKRGGRVVFQDVKKPVKLTFASIQEAMETALAMEKAVNEALLNLHKLADKHNDPALADFIENEFLGEQVDAIKQLANYVTQTKRVGFGLGEYLFDKHASFSLH